MTRPAEDTTDLPLLRDGAPYTWGKIVKIHDIDRYSIVESLDPQAEAYRGAGEGLPAETRFHPYVDDEKCSVSCHTMEEALIYAIAVGKFGWVAALNGKHAEFALICLGLRNNQPKTEE